MKPKDHSQREKILALFQENKKLLFTDIEKATGLRSNALAYHIDKLVADGFLEKQGRGYRLHKVAEQLLPLLTQESPSPLPIVLVAVMNGNDLLMLKRKRRPYKNYWSLIGGKMLLGETFFECAQRLVKEKTGLDCTPTSLNAVLHERVTGEDIIKHGFILFFTKVRVKSKTVSESHYGEVAWFSPKEIAKNKVIPSDHWLYKNKLNSRIDIKESTMFEKNGELFDFTMHE